MSFIMSPNSLFCVPARVSRVYKNKSLK